MGEKELKMMSKMGSTASLSGLPNGGSRLSLGQVEFAKLSDCGPIRIRVNGNKNRVCSIG